MHQQINEIYAYLHGIWRYRWSAIFIAWVVSVVGSLVVYALPDQYESRASVDIDTSTIMKPLLRGLSVDTSPSNDINLMARVLLSRDNLQAVARETDMDHEAQTSKDMDRVVAGLAKAITLTNPANKITGQPTNIYEISYKSTSPELAYKVVSSLLNTLIDNTLKSGRQDTVMAEKFLDEQINEFEKRLSASEALLVEFKKKNIGFMPDEKGDYYARLRNAKDKIEATKSALQVSRHRYNELHKQISGESPVLATRSIDSSSASKLRQYQAQLADLLTQFTDEHPDVKALRARIANLKENRLPEIRASNTPAGNGEDKYNPVYQELKVQESQARIEIGKLQIQLAEEQANLSTLEQSIDVIPQVEANLAKLNRDYEVTRQRYLSLVERRESARLAQKVEEDSSDITFRVVEAPFVPHEPSGPNRLLLLLGTMGGALGAGVAWGVLMFLLYPTFIDYKQLRSMINLPVLGSIGLQMSSQQKQHRAMELRKFLMALLLLQGFFGGVLWYKEPGSMAVREVISDINVFK